MIELTLVNGNKIKVDRAQILALTEIYQGARFLYTEVKCVEEIFYVKETANEIREMMGK